MTFTDDRQNPDRLPRASGRAAGRRQRLLHLAEDAQESVVSLPACGSTSSSPDNPREANQKYLDDLLTELRASRHVQKAVILGMDGVYDQNGRLNQAHTDFLISNDYVLKTAQAHPNELLAGVSINPQRRDAIDEVHRCADAGAVLVKVLPNAQQFDPANPQYKAILPCTGRTQAAVSQSRRLRVQPDRQGSVGRRSRSTPRRAWMKARPSLPPMPAATD